MTCVGIVTVANLNIVMLLFVKTNLFYLANKENEREISEEGGLLGVHGDIPFLYCICWKKTVDMVREKIKVKVSPRFLWRIILILQDIEQAGSLKIICYR